MTKPSKPDHDYLAEATHVVIKVMNTYSDELREIVETDEQFVDEFEALFQTTMSMFAALVHVRNNLKCVDVAMYNVAGLDILVTPENTTQIFQNPDTNYMEVTDAKVH